MLEPTDGSGLKLASEVPTLAWPTRPALHGGALLVAGTSAHRIARHQLQDDGMPGPAEELTEVAAPMPLLVGT